MDLDGGRISAEHDGYAPITHRRDVHVESDRIVIHDALFGAGAADVEVRFRLSERCRAESIPGGWKVYLGEDLLARFVLQGVDLNPIAYREPQTTGPGGVSPCYNQLSPAVCLSWEGKVNLNAEFQLIWNWENRQ